MRRSLQRLTGGLAILALIAACDDGESCRPECRPSADGQDVAVVLPCQGDTYEVIGECNREFNRAPCEDVVFHRCEVREYPSGRVYRICVSEAWVAESAEGEILESCDYSYVAVRVDRQRTAAELPEGCAELEDDFCDASTSGEDFCNFETSGCSWPPNPYL